MARGPVVDRKRQSAQFCGVAAGRRLLHRREGNVLIVRAVLALGRRREQRLRQPRSILQARRAAGCRRPFRSPGIPSSPSRQDIRAQRTRRETSARASPASTGPQADPRRAAARPGNRRRPRRSGGSARCRQEVEPEERIWVRILPLPGMPVPSTWSNAEMRSVATSSKSIVQLRRDRAPCRGQASGFRPDWLSGVLSQGGLPWRELNFDFRAARRGLSIARGSSEEGCCECGREYGEVGGRSYPKKVRKS